MWTHENRPKYNRDHLRYPSDLTDDQWAYVEPLCCESFAIMKESDIMGVIEQNVARTKAA